MNRVKGWFRKEYDKFRKKRWYSKLFDALFVFLVIMLIIPSTRKEVMTYTSKVRMYLTPVEEKEEKKELTGKSTMVFRDGEGEQHNIGEYLDKPVFINYWATWCPPCRAEMPTLEKLYQQYGQDIHFLFISNQPMGKQQDFLNQHNYELPVYQLASRPGGTFSYSVLPTSLIIDRKNRVILRKEGAVNWQSKSVREIFDRLASK